MSETRANQLRSLSERFHDTVVSERLFLRPHLSLADVALRLGVSWYDLSYAVNAYLGKNYKDFVNQLRIEEALRLMRSPAGGRMKIDDLARQAGFSERTTFCRICKKVTGMSPSELQQSCNKSKESDPSSTPSTPSTSKLKQNNL